MLTLNLFPDPTFTLDKVITDPLFGEALDWSARIGLSLGFDLNASIERHFILTAAVGKFFSLKWPEYPENEAMERTALIAAWFQVTNTVRFGMADPDDPRLEGKESKAVVMNRGEDDPITQATEKVEALLGEHKKTVH